MKVTTFEINVSEETLNDLRARLSRTRWTEGIKGEGWDYGTNPAYLRELCAYWQNEFNWRKQEAELNSFNHFRADLDGFGIHFIHERGKGKDPLPIILTHGYPDSFVRFLKIIPMLTAADTDGFSFDVVAPSLPGYGFSDRPNEAGTTFRIADLWAKLMIQELGYQRFAAHGGDWGSMVTEHLARSYSDSLVGIHLTDVPFSHMFQKPGDVTPDETKYLAKMKEFQKKEGAYAMIQGTRPQSLACGLNDSPAGLAAWIVEKFRAWSDCGGDVEKRFTKDELLTNVMIYWITETINSSFLPYYDFMNAGALRWISEKVKEWTGSSQTPAAFAIFPNDLVNAPREWAERFYNVQRWTEMANGGHFAAMEEPELLVEDLRAFFRPLRKAGRN